MHFDLASAILDSLSCGLGCIHKVDVIDIKYLRF